MLENIEVLRADTEWKRAGAYSIRIQGMNRQYHIPLREEFDIHDGEASKYIVLLDDGYPVATCRFYELDSSRVMLGRVVVLPEYRGRHLGAKTVDEAEKWISELGYKVIEIESRTEAVGFYLKSGYVPDGDGSFLNGSFECVRMKKDLR
jgi:predicted GNAT family N-acyltransferase